MKKKSIPLSKKQIFLSISPEEQEELIKEGEEYLSLAQKQSQEKEAHWIPLLPLHTTVIFPHLVVGLTLSNSKKIQYIKKKYKKGGLMGLIATKKEGLEIKQSNFRKTGTLVRIIKIATIDKEHTILFLQGLKEIEVTALKKDKDYFLIQARPLFDKPYNRQGKRTQAYIEEIKEKTAEITSIQGGPIKEANKITQEITSLSFLTYAVAMHFNQLSQKQKILNTRNVLQRARTLLGYLNETLTLLKERKNIEDAYVQSVQERNREAQIKDQISFLQEQINQEDETDAQQLKDKYKQKSKKYHWPDDVCKKIEKALKRIAQIPLHTPEYPIQLQYIDTLLNLPINRYTQDNQNLEQAHNLLEQAHYGMHKVKERLLEQIALSIHLKDMPTGSILCLVGPPGVGKTSIARSIAKALKREYVHLSLGGVEDEAELRGHRRTYLGAMPGKIISLLSQANSSNPIFVLDEIDKLGHHRGDPAAVLLEILDPIQNKQFRDNYVDLPFDLSKVFFIATANDPYKIPTALADRLEYIHLEGYAIEEKINIANQYLIPQVRKEMKISANELKITPQAIEEIVERYTAESGVRQLNQQIQRIGRKLIKRKQLKKKRLPKIGLNEVCTLLGTPRYEKDRYKEPKQPGIAIGLVWSSVGGDITYIESLLYAGSGEIHISGQLGDVMKESAEAALSYIKHHAKRLKIDPRIFKNYDLHIHVPDGSTPKDGPSAGITMATALTSLYTQRIVRPQVAMTGELTLRGSILPVGGIKEKILAAQRNGMKEVILSQQNKKDIEEIEKEYIHDLTFHYVEEMEEVLDYALAKKHIDNPEKWEFPKTTEK